MTRPIPMALASAPVAAMLLFAAAGCRPPSPALEAAPGLGRSQADFHDAPTIAARRTPGESGPPTPHRLEWEPRLLLLGARDVKVRVRLAAPDGPPGRYRFAPDDSFAIVDQASGRPLEIADLRVRRGWLLGTVRRVPRGAPGYYSLAIDQTARGGGRQSFEYAFRAVERIRLALTFDDGPAVAGDPEDGLTEGSPTARVLDALSAWRHGAGKSRQGVSAAFFVLTGPDRFMGRTYPKGETADGLALMARAHREGHLLAVHWGGAYGSQLHRHTSRVDFPDDGRDLDGDGRSGEDRPYDIDGDGVPDGQNALESDLLQCLARIREAGAGEVRFVRPPFYAWQIESRPEVGRRVLETYRRLGLEMVPADARLGDGGYPVVSRFSPMKHVLNSTLRRAVLAGHAEVVLAMHDSNPHTAAGLERWLDRAERAMSGIELGGRRLRPGLDFEFVSSREELAALLAGKRRFAMQRGDREPGAGP